MYFRIVITLLSLLIFLVCCHEKERHITTEEAVEVAKNYVRSLPKRVLPDSAMNFDSFPPPIIRGTPDGFYSITFVDSIQDAMLSIIVSPAGVPEFAAGGRARQPSLLRRRE